MSTGDQSEYMRKKMAERRMGPFAAEPKFMKSGFQMWAENERPARQGGAMKDAEEETSSGRRGNIMKEAKKVGEEMWSEFYKGSGHHIEGNCESSSDEESEDEMEGGRIGMTGRPKYVVTTPTVGTGGAAHLIVPAVAGLAGLATGIYAGVKGQRAVDRRRQRITREELAKVGRGKLASIATKVAMDSASKIGTKLVKKALKEPTTGKGFREGVAESKKAFNALGDVAIHGYDAYGKLAKSDVLGALDSSKGIYKSSMDLAGDVQRAAKEFQGAGHGGRFTPYVPIVSEAKLIGHLGHAAYKKIKGKGKESESDEEAGKGYSGNGYAEMSEWEQQTRKRPSPPKKAKTPAPAPATGTGKKVNARAAIVKKVMKEKGLSLPAASKYVKEHGLYKA